MTVRFPNNLVLAVLLFSAPSSATEPEVAITITASPARLVCITQCGLVAPHGNCQELQEAETRALQAYATVLSDWTYDRMCSALEGWRVEIHQQSDHDKRACGDSRWLITKELCAAGFTHPLLGKIEVMNDRWLVNPLVHEFAHVFQVMFGEDIGHCRWTQRGIKYVLQRLRGKPDDSEESECAPLESFL